MLREVNPRMYPLVPKLGSARSPPNQTYKHVRISNYPIPGVDSTDRKNSSMEKPRKSTNTVGAYAVQCGECFKWRVISTKEEYETIRHNFIEDPWVCHKNPNLSCDDPSDTEYDASRVWVIDKPNIPKSPPGVERLMVMRSDYSKLDVNYVMPNGKKVRSSVEVEKFLEANSEYKGKMSPADFSFTSPKIPEEMVPKDIEPKSSSARSKKLKTENSN